MIRVCIDIYYLLVNLWSIGCYVAMFEIINHGPKNEYFKEKVTELWNLN